MFIWYILAPILNFLTTILFIFACFIFLGVYDLWSCTNKTALKFKTYNINDHTSLKIIKLLEVIIFNLALFIFYIFKPTFYKEFIFEINWKKRGSKLILIYVVGLPLKFFQLLIFLIHWPWDENIIDYLGQKYFSMNFHFIMVLREEGWVRNPKYLDNIQTIINECKFKVCGRQFFTNLNKWSINANYVLEKKLDIPRKPAHYHFYETSDKGLSVQITTVRYDQNNQLITFNKHVVINNFMLDKPSNGYLVVNTPDPVLRYRTISRFEWAYKVHDHITDSSAFSNAFNDHRREFIVPFKDLESEIHVKLKLQGLENCIKSEKLKSMILLNEATDFNG